MLNENAQKLVNALRSGEYAQIIGALHKDSGFCCLGVACDLFIKETDTSPGWTKSIWGGFTQSFDDETAVLPDRVRVWLGFRTNQGNFTPVVGAQGSFSLASANDSGVSFQEIADMIEAEPDGLFADV